MTVEEVLIAKIKILPTNRQQEMLDFAEFLEQKEAAPPPPRRSLYGVPADLNVSLTDEDIAEVRREMWGTFPREHFFDEETK